MGLLISIFLILLGLLTIFPVLQAKKSAVGDFIDPFRPYQKGIGAVAALLGLAGLLMTILNLNLIAYAPVYWFAQFTSNLVLIGLGMLLGYDVLQQNIMQKNQSLDEKAKEVLEKLELRKLQLGYVGIGFGVLGLLFRLAN